MIVDHMGQPFPEKSIGEQYTEALLRSFRETKENMTIAITRAGWTIEQYRHWVVTGEEPQP